MSRVGVEFISHFLAQLKKKGMRSDDEFLRLVLSAVDSGDSAQLNSLVERIRVTAYDDDGAHDHAAISDDKTEAVSEGWDDDAPDGLDVRNEERQEVVASVGGVDRCIQALDRRLADLAMAIEAEVAANMGAFQDLVESAAQDHGKLEDSLVRLLDGVKRVQHPEWRLGNLNELGDTYPGLQKQTGLLHVKRQELRDMIAEMRASEIHARFQAITDRVNAFRDSAEACSLILLEFGDLADAVDALKELEAKLDVLDECGEVASREELERIYENVQTLIVRRVEDAFSNVLIIQPFVDGTGATITTNLINSAMKGILVHHVSSITTSTTTRDVDGDTIDVGVLEVRYGVAADGGNLDDTFRNLAHVLHFLSDTFFTSLTESIEPPQELVQILWPSLASEVIDRILTPRIPTTRADLVTFAERVARPCAGLEDTLDARGWTREESGGEATSWRHLSGFCAGVETHYCSARWETCMARARGILVGNGFDVVQVGGRMEEQKIGLDVIDSILKRNMYVANGVDDTGSGLPMLYPPGSTGAEGLSWLTHFPRCSVSVRSKTILDMIEELLVEATAEGVTAYCSSRLYLLTRDILTLDLSLTPIKHQSHLATLPQAALIYNNDCLYMAHQLMYFGPRFRHALTTGVASGEGKETVKLLKSSEVGYVDLAAIYRKRGAEILNTQLRIQKTQLLELLASANGLGMGDLDRTQHVTKVLAQVMHTLRQLLCVVWAPPVAPAQFHLRVSTSVVNWVLEAVVAEVSSAIDIGDEESRRLYDALLLLEDACAGIVAFAGRSSIEDAFAGSIGNAVNEMEVEKGKRVMRRLVVSYTSFKKLREMLVMSFAGIMDMFRGGRGPEGMLADEEAGGLEEFSNETLCRLAKALFSDTPLRQKNIGEIQSRIE
ncbi:Centromere/kinetochore Zw10-domain-containing protein [Chytriomyces sp. MP71]|nr:Centromere/kinetochore Zw10-domain-containing protein [Chytriomyces sp. MP71]